MCVLSGVMAAAAQSGCVEGLWVYRTVSMQRYVNSGLGCIVKQERPQSSQQQLSERPGVWSVPHQWGVQLWLRMKEKERIKSSQGLSNPPKTHRQGSVQLQEGFFIWKTLRSKKKRVFSLNRGGVYSEQP